MGCIYDGSQEHCFNFNGGSGSASNWNSSGTYGWIAGQGNDNYWQLRKRLGVPPKDPTTDFYMAYEVRVSPSRIVRTHEFTENHFILVSARNGSDLAIWQDKIAGESQSGLTIPSGTEGVFIGKREDDGVGSNFNGYLAELVIYNVALSDADREAIENYLYDKWLAEPLPTQCPVESPDFSTPTGWTLTGPATISNGLLTLPPGASASQPISTTINPNTSYTVVVSGTGATSDTDTINLTFGSSMTALPFPDMATTYNVVVTSTAISSPTLQLTGISGTVQIDYVCYSSSQSGTVGYVYGQCLTDLVPNGEFESADDWFFVNGAAYNSVGQNAWLPAVEGGAWENQGVSAVGPATMGWSMPDIDPADHILVEFDAHTNEASGNISAIYQNQEISGSVYITYNLEVDIGYTTFQNDVSQLSGKTVHEFLFYNSSYVFTQTNGVTPTNGIFVDNVCVFISQNGAVVSAPASGYAGLGVNCANVSTWLSATVGINFPAIEVIAQQELSIWNPEDWVPWLAGKLWLNAAKPIICLMLALFENGPALAILNWFEWSVRQPGLALAWLGGVFSAIISGGGDWLIWGALSALAVVGAISPFFSAIITGFGWLGAVSSWLMGGGEALTNYGVGQMMYWMNDLLNFLISSWNVIFTVIGLRISEVVSLAVSVWNESVAPWLSGWSLVLFLVGQFGVLIDLAVFAGTVVMTLLKLIWSFLTALSQMPLTFYQEFNGAVNGTAFELIPACQGDLSDGCLILFGFEVVNQTTSHTITYPIVIVGIIVTTVTIFWKRIWNLLSLKFN